MRWPISSGRTAASSPAPNEEVTTPSDVAKWNSLTYEPVDYALMSEAADYTSLKETAACAGGSCELV
jgi:ribonucleoside-triphosphate reductase (thioredoxin)